MSKKKNEDLNVEDFLSMLDDEEEIIEEQEDDLVDILSELDDEETNEEPKTSSFDDYASKLIKELEGELEDDNDNLSSLSSMLESDDESNQNSDDLMSILDNLDSLEDEENNSDGDDDLIGLLSEEDEEDEYDDKSIEELFDDFVNAIKGLSNNEKDTLDEKLDEYKQNKVTETDDLSLAGLTISDDGTISQTNFNKSLKKLTIKKSYNGIKVKKLVSAICSQDDDIELEEVILEGDIYIESSFEGCPNLNKIDAKGKLEIGPNNFAATPKLNIELDGNRYIKINGNDYYILNKGVYRSNYVSVKKGCNLIDAYAFMFSKIVMLDIPSSVKKIGRFAFTESYELVNVFFSEGLQFIEFGAFNNCRALESIDFPDSLIFIGSEAFNGCDKLKQVIISRNTKYADDAFPSWVKIISK